MPVQFPELAELLGNDRDKVRLVVRAFYRSAAMDLQRLERAADARQWQTVRELAQRIHVGCLQVCERNAADAVAALARIPGEFFADAYARRRADIVELLNRAEEFSGCRITDSEHASRLPRDDCHKRSDDDVVLAGGTSSA